MTVYRLREVDASDDEIAETINTLHDLYPQFPKLKDTDFDTGHWWLVSNGASYVAYAGMVPSDRYLSAGYYKRVAVVPAHRGNGLQLRLTRALESRARRNGWNSIVSDTTDTVHSANNFIKAGYRLFEPAYPWAFPNSLYWIKSL